MKLFIYMHICTCVFIWLTCRYFYRFCFAWSIKFLINFGFRLKHLVYVFIFVTSISNLFPITSKVMALWLKLKFSKYCGNLFFLNDIVVMSFKFLCDGFFLWLWMGCYIFAIDSWWVIIINLMCTCTFIYLY